MPRIYVTAQERHLIAERAKGRCEYCQSPVDFATQSFSVEHIIPVSRGGEAILDNLALACPGCNSHKYTRIVAPDSVTGAPVPLYNPRSQRWQDHFRWNEDFTRIVGVTPTGRATVGALQMNRPGVVNLRRVLFATGGHPPAAEDE
jgi:5-methylcytosine-specific restriction endonuclease McrA